MGYTLGKPFTNRERALFIIEHQGLTPVETDSALYMLEDHEELQDDVIVDISDIDDYIAKTAEVLSDSATAKRDRLLGHTDWICARHRDQIEAGIDTTLTPEEYSEVLAYRQALRDWPATDGWPDAPMPTPPDWMTVLAA